MMPTVSPHSRRATVRDVLRAAVAFVVLGAASLLIGACPHRWVRRLLGGPDDAQPAAVVLTPAQVLRAERTAVAIRRAVRRAPWRSDCYPQALTARVHLRVQRVPHRMSFGLRRSPEGEMLAHAWVRAADVDVTGGDGADFAEVGSFTWIP